MQFLVRDRLQIIHPGVDIDPLLLPLPGQVRLIDLFRKSKVSVLISGCTAEDFIAGLGRKDVSNLIPDLAVIKMKSTIQDKAGKIVNLPGCLIYLFPPVLSQHRFLLLPATDDLCPLLKSVGIDLVYQVVVYDPLVMMAGQ